MPMIWSCAKKDFQARARVFTRISRRYAVTQRKSSCASALPTGGRRRNGLPPQRRLVFSRDRGAGRPRRAAAHQQDGFGLWRLAPDRFVQASVEHNPARTPDPFPDGLSMGDTGRGRRKQQ